jgi:hypothetical protein
MVRPCFLYCQRIDAGPGYEEAPPAKPIAGMLQVDAPVGGLRIAMATGVLQVPAVKAGGRHVPTSCFFVFAANWCSLVRELPADAKK